MLGNCPKLSQTRVVATKQPQPALVYCSAPLQGLQTGIKSDSSDVELAKIVAEGQGGPFVQNLFNLVRVAFHQVFEGFPSIIFNLVVSF